jgi:hypothetical protein
MCLFRKRTYKITYVTHGAEYKIERRVYYLKARSANKAAEKMYDLDPYLIEIVAIEEVEAE